jgi:hypothetical protein
MILSAKLGKDNHKSINILFPSEHRVRQINDRHQLTSEGFYSFYASSFKDAVHDLDSCFYQFHNILHFNRPVSHEGASLQVFGNSIKRYSNWSMTVWYMWSSESKTVLETSYISIKEAMVLLSIVTLNKYSSYQNSFAKLNERESIIFFWDNDNASS